MHMFKKNICNSKTMPKNKNNHPPSTSLLQQFMTRDDHFGIIFRKNILDFCGHETEDYAVQKTSKGIRVSLNKNQEKCKTICNLIAANIKFDELNKRCPLVFCYEFRIDVLSEQFVKERKVTSEQQKYNKASTILCERIQSLTKFCKKHEFVQPRKLVIDIPAFPSEYAPENVDGFVGALDELFLTLGGKTSSTGNPRLNFFESLTISV